MTRVLAGVLIILCAAGRVQATPQGADVLVSHPYCRPKASTAETPAPDHRFDAVLAAKPAVSAPVLSRSAAVKYPTAAMAFGICGTVVVQILVNTSGKVGAVRVVESLDKVNGLDADALKTVAGWQFKPGLENGKAVATVITARVEYVLDALEVDPFEARNNIGQFAMVCGFLRPAAAAKADAGMRSFEFALDKKSVVVRVPESAKDVQDKASVMDAVMCAIGPVGKIDGRPEITVAQADRLVKEPMDVELVGVAKHSDPGITKPKIRQQFHPKYTPQAMSHKIVGLVEMDAVVLTDGRVGNIKVTRSLDAVYGLDKEAVATLRRWRFEPGLKDGRPIPVAVTIQMEFRLH